MKNNQIIIDTNNTNTAYVTKEFYKRAHIFGTPEFKLLREFITEMGNDVTIKVKTRNINRSADQEKRKNLKVARMLNYIKSRPDAAIILAEFDKAKMRSGVQQNPRKYIQDWFMAMFPNYEEIMDEMVAIEKAELESLNTEEEAA